MRILLGVLAVSALALFPQAPVQAQEQEAPGSCNQTYVRMRGWEQCLKDAEPGSGTAMLAAANLGTQALISGDFEAAAKYYDLSKPEGQESYSDIILHAHRAHVFARVGRDEDALADARAVMAYVDMGQFDFYGTPLNDETKAYALGLVLDILKKAGDERYQSALETYVALPLAEPVDIITRAGTLAEVGEYDLALADSNEAVLTYPDIGVAWNNRCYLFVLMGDYESAVADCDRAVELEPHLAGIRHSRAEALAGAGRCAEAEADLALAREWEPSVAIYKEPISCTPAEASDPAP